MISKEDYRNRIDTIVDTDKRYHRESYSFIVMALNYAVLVLFKTKEISASEMLEGIKHYGLEKFGPMTRAVLEYWGVYSCSDFALIIYNLIDKGVVVGDKESILEDFEKYSFDFKDSLEKPYVS